MPGGRLCHFRYLACGDLQIADLIVFNGFKTRIGNRQRISGYHVPDLKIVLGVRASPTPTRNSRASLPTLPRTLSAYPRCVWLR